MKLSIVKASVLLNFIMSIVFTVLLFFLICFSCGRFINASGYVSYGCLFTYAQESIVGDQLLNSMAISVAVCGIILGSIGYKKKLGYALKCPDMVVAGKSGRTALLFNMVPIIIEPIVFVLLSTQVITRGDTMAELVTSAMISFIIGAGLFAIMLVLYILAFNRCKKLIGGQV